MSQKAIVIIDIPDIEGVNYPFNYLPSEANVTLDYGNELICLSGEVKECNPDMRKKVSEYINELSAEYERCISIAEKTLTEYQAHIKNAKIEGMTSAAMAAATGYIKSISSLLERAKTLYEVENDLRSRLEELV